MVIKKVGADDIMSMCAEVQTEMTLENPARLIIMEEFIEFSARLTKKIMSEEKEK